MCSSQQLAFLMLQTQQRVETRHDVMRSDPAGLCLSCPGAANKIDVENMSAVLIFMVTSHPQVAQFAHNLTPHLDFVQEYKDESENDADTHPQAQQQMRQQMVL